MNVLVIAPHPDDEAIGCGGTLLQHALAGDRVVAAFLTSGELGLESLPKDLAWKVREEEAAAAAEILGVAALEFFRLPDWTAGEHVEEGAGKLAQVLQREAPGLVYLPHAAEWHPDHRAALTIFTAALLREEIPVPEARAFEVWTPLSEYDCVEDISATMRGKLAAVRCYRSQLGDFRYDRAVRGLNQYRGALAGRCGFAEVFQTIELENR